MDEDTPTAQNLQHALKEIVRFCRGAGDAAAVLASLSLEKLSAPTSFTSSPMPPSHGRLFRAMAALDVANLLLALTLGGLQLGCRLEPTAVQRLVSCASVALGPAAQAAQLLYNEYAVADKPPDHHSIASEVADCFAKIFDVTAQAVAIVRRLKGQGPASRLMATGRGKSCVSDKRACGARAQ